MIRLLVVSPLIVALTAVVALGTPWLARWLNDRQQ